LLFYYATPPAENQAREYAVLCSFGGKNCRFLLVFSLPSKAGEGWGGVACGSAIIVIAIAVFALRTLCGGGARLSLRGGRSCHCEEGAARRSNLI